MGDAGTHGAGLRPDRMPGSVGSPRRWTTALLMMAGLHASGTVLAAQVLRGVVLADSIGVAGASVSAMNSLGVRQQTESDSAGHFVIVLPEPGVYRVTVERTGYLAAGPVSVDAGFEEEVSLTIRLATFYELEPIEVTARRNYSKGAMREAWEERVAWMRQLGIGRHLTRTEIEQRPGVDAAELLRGIPRVRVVRSGIVMTGSRGGCSPQVYVDGIRDVGRQGILTQLSSHDIEAVEVYRSAAETPPEYIDFEGCGVVLFWTRRDLGAGGGRLTWARALALLGTLGLILIVTR